MSRKSVAYKHGLEHRGKLSGDKNPARRKDVRIKIGKKLKGRIITDSWKEKIRQRRLIKRRPEQSVTKSKVIRERLAGRKKPDNCEICGVVRKIRGLCFDHDHQTGMFRGWICNNCNSALGLVHDDITVLEKMIRYIKKNKSAL
jgi:hypothetical protein